MLTGLHSAFPRGTRISATLVLALALLPMALASRSARAEIRELFDLDTSTQSSTPHNFISGESLVYFTATDAEHGDGIWVTDGTSARTRLAFDPNLTSGDQLEFHGVLGDTLFFDWKGPEFSEDEQLWVSDGTTGGTHLLVNAYPNSHQDGYDSFVVCDGEVMAR
jgi:ELWxxDGT repeat protein